MDNKNENVYMKQENEYVQLVEKWAKIEKSRKYLWRIL